MAFTTRTGRIVAIGHGSLRSARTLWTFSSLLLLAPVTVAVMVAVQLAYPETQPVLEAPFRHMAGFTLAALALVFLLRTFTITCGIGLFAGPSGRTRDQIFATLRSRTAWLAALSVIATLAQVAVLRAPSGEEKDAVFVGLTISLVLLDVLTHRGLHRIMAANSAVPYFDGMSEQQKRAADRPWPTWRRPSFPDPKALVSAADAQRYARRANDIALLHEWIGIGLVVVFSAFVGTTILEMFESTEPIGQLPVLLVLGFVALGIWLQRRAGSYRRLAESFSDNLRRKPQRTLTARSRGMRRSRGIK